MNTEGDGADTFFALSSAGQHVPRAVYVDLEPTVIGKITFQPSLV